MDALGGAALTLMMVNLVSRPLLRLAITVPRMVTGFSSATSAPYCGRERVGEEYYTVSPWRLPYLYFNGVPWVEIGQRGTK